MSSLIDPTAKTALAKALGLPPDTDVDVLVATAEAILGTVDAFFDKLPQDQQLVIVNRCIDIQNALELVSPASALKFSPESQ